MKWLVIQTRLSVHARLSTANIIKIFIKTFDHLEKRASIRQRIHCYLICHWNWSPYFFPSFFSAGALLMLTISITKLFWKFAVWRCVDDLGKDIYRFHVRYIHSSFYLICSIVNVYLLLVKIMSALGWVYDVQARVIHNKVAGGIFRFYKCKFIISSLTENLLRKG